MTLYESTVAAAFRMLLNFKLPVYLQTPICALHIAHWL